ncbi:MAG TPA: GNAT family N-acetyltransferase [Mycobacteriales bacterium]|nr:GNAT family N-acetyltransferase [Mycobacteriales bacterium]
MPQDPFEVPGPGTGVTLRVATPVGPISVVGEIVSADSDVWAVRRRDGEVVEVSVASIEARRVVPPGRAATTSAQEIEQVAAFGWRAVETVRLGEWLLRASSGFTRRANSALTIGDPGCELDRAIATVSGWYAERGLPPIVMTADGASSPAVAEGLVERRWASLSHSHVMTGEVSHALRAMPDAVGRAVDSGLELRVEDTPDDAWYACYAENAVPVTDAARQVLEGHPAVVFASLREGNRAVAVARANVDARWTGISAVRVTADRRRSGLGAAITLAACKEAARRGGRHVYLQVEVDNSGAIELYRRLNLRVHHDYRYWTTPTDIDNGCQ